MSLPLRATTISPLIHSPNLHILPFSHKKCPSNLIPCFSKPNNFGKLNGPDLVSSEDLASEVLLRIKTQMNEREIAMKKSKNLLFFELCEYLNLDPQELKNKWVKMNPDEKMGLVKGFVSDWGLNFHPLSPKSVRDLVDEFVIEDMVERKSCDLGSTSGSDSGVILPRLKNMIMGLSQNK